MSLFKKKINPHTKRFDYVFRGNLVSFKAGVATVGDLPSSSNTEGDARVTNDTGHLYIWDGSTWQDQGDVIDIKWATLEDKPTSSVENIDDAVNKKHDRQHSIVNSSDHSDKVDYVDIPYSPTILTGGFVSAGTNAGTVKIDALTALLRTTDSVMGALTKITLTEQDNQALPLANTVYNIILDYNNNSPLIRIQVAQANETTQIGLAICMKDDSDNVHFCNCGARLNNGLAKFHKRANTLRSIELASGCVIGEAGTRNITITSGVVYHGINRLTPFSGGIFDTSVTAPDTFTYFYRDGDTGWTRVIGQTQIDSANYDDDSGTLEPLIAQQYGIHWVYLHPDDEHIYIVYGQDSYRLSEAAVATPPSTLPIEVSDFSVLIGRILIEKNSASFEYIQSAIDTLFNPTGVEDHNESANLQGGLVGEYYHLTSDEHTNKYIQGNEIKIKVYSQDAEPTLSANEFMAFWKDTNDSNRIYLLFRRGEADQVSVELA